MSKKISNILIICFVCVSTLLSCFLPCCKNILTAKASDNSTQIYQTLINPNMTDDEWLTVYGGKTGETSTFTPFNYSLNARMSGKSIVPSPSNMDEYRRFENATYNVLDNGGISENENLSLGLWVYFSDISIHGLSIKLSVDDNNYVIITLTKQQVIDVVKKTSSLNEQAFAWNYIEIPFDNLTVYGEIYENNELKKFNTVTFSYTSEVTYSQDAEFAGFRFYGLYLQKSTVDIITATGKQDYAVYSFNFWNENQLQSIVVGDSLQTKLLQNAVNYAWVGEVNLLAHNNIISWQVIVTTPSEETESYNFGEIIEFNETGYYTISYKAESTNQNLAANLYDTIYVYVRSDNLIYFDFSEYEIDINEETTVKLNIDELLNKETLEVLSVTIGDTDKVKITQIDNYNYLVEGLEEGETTLTIKINAKRNSSDKIKEYSATTNFTINNGQDNNSTIIIILYITLGIIFFAGLVLGIKNIIIARKNDVK